jgi:hypothetical protein
LPEPLPPGPYSTRMTRGPSGTRSTTVQCRVRHAPGWEPRVIWDGFPGCRRTSVDGWTKFDHFEQESVRGQVIVTFLSSRKWIVTMTTAIRGSSSKYKGPNFGHATFGPSGGQARSCGRPMAVPSAAWAAYSIRTTRSARFGCRGVHEVEQVIEPATRISHRPTVKLGLHPRVLLSASLAGPAPSGSTDTSRLCQGCSHPPRHHPDQRRKSDTGSVTEFWASPTTTSACSRRPISTSPTSEPYWPHRYRSR